MGRGSDTFTSQLALPRARLVRTNSTQWSKLRVTGQGTEESLNDEQQGPC